MARSSSGVESVATKVVPDSTGSPQLLERTFSVLGLFASGRSEWTTTELSQQCGLPVPTVHRIVVSLSSHGFLVRDPSSKRFRLGPAAIALGRAALSAADLPTIASRLLPRLTAATEETSLLTVPTVAHDGSVCLVRVESPHQLRLSVEPGHRLPLHAGASQKAILAFLPEEDRQRVVSGPLEKFCRLTLDSPDALEKEIEAIRSRGWAYSMEETNPGVWGVAIALLNNAGHAIAAVGVAGPAVRLSQEIVRMSVEETQSVAQELAESLGLTSSSQGKVVVPARLAPQSR
jgi:IclR family transcriptional regulator, acetate operon repressor